MYSKPKHKEEAYRFISFLYSREGGQLGFAGLGRAIPGRRSVAYTPYFTRPDTPQHEEIFLEIMNEYAWAQPTHVLDVKAGPIIQK